MTVCLMLVEFHEKCRFSSHFFTSLICIIKNLLEDSRCCYRYRIKFTWKKKINRKKSVWNVHRRWWFDTQQCDFRCKRLNLHMESHTDGTTGNIRINFCFWWWTWAFSPRFISSFRLCDHSYIKIISVYTNMRCGKAI